jgi:nucleolar MIF4G domain-containing protein 1
VGGMEVVKNVKTDNWSSSQKISASRMDNVAKAYAWWIAKDCSSLTILKVGFFNWSGIGDDMMIQAVDFTLLQPQTSKFLTTLFVQLFASSQTTTPAMDVNPRNFSSTRDRQAVEQIFHKATKSETLAIGIIYFLSRNFQDAQGSEVAKWGSEVAMETLRTA